MPASALDSRIYAELFGDPELRRLFGDSADVRAMLLVEGALAKAQGAAGLIPEVSAAAIHRASMEVQVDPASLAGGAGESAVPVPALVSAFRAAMSAPEHANWLHWGATSQDIVDTALALRLRQALAILETRLVRTIRALGDLAGRHAALPMAARTYGQTAVPTSFGAVAAAWGDPLLTQLSTLGSVRHRVAQVSLSGAAGTLSVMGDAGPEVRRGLAQALDLRDPGRSWHTDRSGIAALSAWATQITAALGKFGADLVLLASSDCGEVRLGKSGGSSTMPQKANPVGPSVLGALAAVVGALNGAVQGAAVHRQQRDGAAWMTEWLSLPQMVLMTGKALTLAGDLASDLEPVPEAMKRHLHAGSDTIFAEALSFALARTLPRAEAQAKVGDLSAEATAEQAIAGRSRARGRHRPRRFRPCAGAGTGARRGAPLCRCGKADCGGDVKLADCEVIVTAPPAPGWGGRYWILVKVTTADGITGWGECYGATVGPAAMTAVIADVFARHMAGENPENIERMFRRVYSSGFTGRPDPTVIGAFSGLEIACWDILGKARDRPVWALLGGRVNDRLRAYTYLYPGPDDPLPGFWGSAELSAAAADRAVAQGYTAVKFDPAGPYQIRGGHSPSMRDIARSVEVCAAVRDAVGDRADLLFGTHGQLSTGGAIRLGQAIAPYRPLWFEEPVPPDDAAAMARVARGQPVPVAAGERLCTVAEFATLLRAEAVEVVQPALGRAGGLWEGRKIAALAQAFGVEVAPHLYAGPVLWAANLHLATTIPNLLMVETIETSFHAELIGQALEVDAGHVRPPEGPGLGIEVDEALARSRPWTGTGLHLEMQEAQHDHGTERIFGGGAAREEP